MQVISIIFRPIIIFALVASFSLFFMSLFLIAGILTAKIQRNVVERINEVSNIGGYITIAAGGLITGFISLVAMTFL